MGRPARNRPAGYPGHRRQSQRRGDAILCWNSRGDGERGARTENARLARHPHQRQRRRRRRHRPLRPAGVARVRLSFPKYFFAAGLIVLAASVPARADYVVLRSGARLNVTGYEILGDHYRLHLRGGVAEVPVAEIVAIEPEEIFEPSTEPLTDKTPFQKLIRDAAARYNLDPTLIHSVIAIESNFDPKAVSRKNARGLMHLMASTSQLLVV